MMLDCSVSSDLVKTRVIEASAPFTRTADLMLGDSVCDPLKRDEFQDRAISAAAANWQLHDVTVVPPHGLVFSGGHMVKQTGWGFHPRQIEAAEAALAQPHCRLDDRPVFVGLNRFFGNYFHVLTQIVPAIAGYRTEPGFRQGRLLVGVHSPVLHHALQLCGVGIPEIVSIATMPPIDVGTLTLSSLLTPCDDPSPFCLSVFDRMIERAMAPVGGPLPQRIYVWRVDSKMRPLRNEIELVVMLSRFGIEPVVLSMLGLDEQIRLFRNARLVIGPHGAGLANVVFAAPGAVLYELLPDHYITPCVCQLARLRGLHYWCDVHRSEARPGLWRHDTPWTVDVDAVARRVTEILSTYDLSDRRGSVAEV